MLALIAIALACTEPDGGVCVQQVNVGPFNATMPTVTGGMGQYTTYVEQDPVAPQNACIFLTRFISVCSCFDISSFNATTGNGGGLCFYHGGHRAMRLSDWGHLSPSVDDDMELGAIGATGVPYRWKRVSTYEHVIAPRSLTCSAEADGGCFTDSAPRGSNVRFSCPGPGICEWAPGDEYLDNIWYDSLDGMQVCVRNVSAYPLLVRSSAAVKLEEDFLGGEMAMLCFERLADRWVERSRKFP